MKKQHLFIAMLFITAAITLIGCNKKEEVSSDKITVYGIVSCENNGEPISGVTVECLTGDPDNLGGVVTRAVTGSDGTYEFTLTNVDKKQSYTVMADKNGYDYTGAVLSFGNVDSDGKLRCDLQLYKRNH